MSTGSRRSYRGLTALPAWLLYDGPRLVGSIRAENADAARDIFKDHGFSGTHMRRGENHSPPPTATDP